MNLRGSLIIYTVKYIAQNFSRASKIDSHRNHYYFLYSFTPQSDLIITCRYKNEIKQTESWKRTKISTINSTPSVLRKLKRPLTCSSIFYRFNIGLFFPPNIIDSTTNSSVFYREILYIWWWIKLNCLQCEIKLAINLGVWICVQSKQCYFIFFLPQFTFSYQILFFFLISTEEFIKFAATVLIK